MSGTWGPILQYGAPPLMAAIIAGIFSVYNTHKTHKATAAADEAAKDTARAAIQDTFTRAYEAADKHWAIYTEAMQKRCEALEKDVSKNAQRLEDAELRSEADKSARIKAEHLYSLSIVYLRRVIRWINDNLPGEDYPSPPPELHLDL